MMPSWYRRYSLYRRLRHIICCRKQTWPRCSSNICVRNAQNFRPLFLTGKIPCSQKLSLTSWVLWLKQPRYLTRLILLRCMSSSISTMFDVHGSTSTAEKARSAICTWSSVIGLLTSACWLLSYRSRAYRCKMCSFLLLESLSQILFSKLPQQGEPRSD